jgi:predicted metalloprotease with PDZ domain
MRLAYRRYSGEHGFTFEQFRQTADEVAHADLENWFQRAIRSTDELDYTEALDWYGLRFANGEGSTGKWKLEIRSDATGAQRMRWQKLTESPSNGGLP